MTILNIIVAIILPPLAVFFKRGLSMVLLVNIILTLIFYLPGLIHALWVLMQDE